MLFARLSLLLLLILPSFAKAEILRVCDLAMLGSHTHSNENEDDYYRTQYPMGDAIDELYDRLLGLDGHSQSIALLVSEPRPMQYRQDLFSNWNSRGAEDLIERLNRFDRFGDVHRRSIIESDEFYHDVYSHYSDVYRSELIRDLMQIDSSLASYRVSQGTVRDADHVYATWRVYDGGAMPFYRAEPDWRRELNETPVLGRPSFLSEPASLPLMRMNRAPSRQFPKMKVEDYLEGLLEKGENVFELGKFSAKGPPEVRERAVKLVELQWLMLANRHPDSVFVAHVMSLAHARLYKKYGFEIVEKLDVYEWLRQKYGEAAAEAFKASGQSLSEYVLLVPGWKFSESLLKLLGITRTLQGEKYPKWQTPNWYRSP